MSTRKFLRAGLELNEFLDILNSKSVKYVVLRSQFNTGKTNSDIDILFEDSYLTLLDNLLVRKDANTDGFVRVDAYSTTGMKGYAFNKIPYYPTVIAERILDDRLLNEDGFYVPSIRTELLAYLFHVIFHKSDQKPQTIISTTIIPEAYKIKLTAIVKSLNFDDIFDCLAKRDWLPPIDWVRKLNFDRESPLYNLYARTEEETSISVFLIRDEAISKSMRLKFHRIIYDNGMHIIYAAPLNANEKQLATKRLRGGNWGSGPYEYSGGLPSYIYIVYDPQPEHCIELIGNSYVSNNRFVRMKQYMRESASYELGFSGNINCIHSTDDNREAYEYQKMLFPKLYDEIGARIKYAASNDIKRYKVIDTLKDNGYRSKIELIEYNETLAIKKTFNSKCTVFLNREIVAHTLEKLKPNIPKLLGYDDRALITEYVDFDIDSQKELLNIKKREIVGLVQALWESGYAHMDLHPGNLIVSRDNKLYLVDFEFLYPYAKKPFSILESFDLVGMPEFKEWGIKGNDPISFINKTWIEYFGLTLKEITVEQMANTL